MNKIFSQYLLLNIPLVFVISVGFLMNVLQPLFYDVSYITPIIFIITCLTVAWMGVTFWKFDESQILFASNPEHTMGSLRLPFYVEDLVVALGFLGTVIGVFIGFQHFPEGAFTDAAKMQEFVRMMLTGFSTELHSLMMGLVCRIWISILIFIQRRRILELIYG